MELRDLRYFLVMGEVLKMSASAVREKRACAYPFDPVSAGSHYHQLQDPRQQPPRAFLILRPLGIARHAGFLERHVNRKQPAPNPT